jgi:hypothetical protein
MIEIAIGFMSGVLVTLVGAWISSHLDTRNRRAEELEKAQFEIYMRLLDINQLYFYVTAAEVHGEEPPIELRRTIREKAWALKDKLREFDRVQHTEGILDVLFSDDYESARDRARNIDVLLDELGSMVNPRYTNAIRRIDKINQAKMVEKPVLHSNAPGATFPL